MKKNSLFENIIMIIISIALFVCAILTNLKIIAFKNDNQTLIIVVFYIAAIYSMVSGILGIRKCLRIKKSVYHIFKNDVNEQEIKNKISITGIAPEDIEFNNDIIIEIIAKYGEGEFNLMIDKESIKIEYYANDSYYDNLDEEMKKLIDEMGMSLSPFESTKDEVLKKFVNFIAVNKDKL